MPPPSAGRVAGRPYGLPAPSEPYMHLSTHTAQALDNALRSTRLLHWQCSQPVRYYDRAGYRVAYGGGSRTSNGPCDRADFSACFLRRLAGGSRTPTPEGSQPPCGWDTY